MVLNPYRLAAAVSGSVGEMVRVTFRSGSRVFDALVPVHELFVSIKDVLVFEEYEIDPYFRVASLPADATVLDVGAFAGLFSLKASSFARRVISLEPSPRNHALLLKNVERNHASNIEARQLGVSSRGGLFGFRENGSGSHFVKAGESSSTVVHTARLRDLVDEVGGVDLLKLDVEGAEEEIILGSDDSTLSRVQRLVAELHFPPLDRQKLHSLVLRLEAAGMTVRVLNKPIRGLALGVGKPWSSQIRLDGKYAFLYRLFLSGTYAVSPAFAARESVKLAGELSILYARKE